MNNTKKVTKGKPMRSETDAAFDRLLLALRGVPNARMPTREEFDAVNLRIGKGTGKEGDHCALQVVRWWEGLDPALDTVPETDSQVCGFFLIRFQDAIKDDRARNRLIP